MPTDAGRGLVYRCAKCDERIHARVVEMDSYSNGFAVGCRCTTLDACPYEMGQAETPECWMVERLVCCRRVETTEMNTLHGEHADVQCPECGWKYMMNGKFSSRPDDPRTDRDENQRHLVTDGGTERETGIRLESHEEWPEDDWTENILFSDFLHGSSQVAPALIRESDVPKFSHEGGTTVFGPLDELTHEMFTELSRTAEEIEKDCAKDGDYQGAERYKAAKREFENLAVEVRKAERCNGEN